VKPPAADRAAGSSEAKTRRPETGLRPDPEGNMTVEEQVGASLQAERAAVERLLREATAAVGVRREALARRAQGAGGRREDVDFIDVADAVAAYEATVDRARNLQDRLRELGSAREYERRVEEARSAAPAAAAAG
jgi:hypothetical protein